MREEYRGKGIGKLLFEAYLEEAKNCGAKLAKWQVLDWNELGKSFYRKYNTEVHLGWGGKLANKNVILIVYHFSFGNFIIPKNLRILYFPTPCIRICISPPIMAMFFKKLTV